MDSDRKWEILQNLLSYIEDYDGNAASVAFFLRHDYITVKDYPMAVVSDPNARLVGICPTGARTLYNEQTLFTLTGRELKRKLDSPIERIMAIKELSHLIDADIIYEEKTNDNA